MTIRNTGKRVLMLVSYSNNNADGTYKLTCANHIAYCRKNNYSYMAVNEPYSMYTNVTRVKDLLREFDIVFTCDSDIVFTDMSRRVEEFAHEYINVCVEEWCCHQFSFFNGGFLIFFKKDIGVFNFIDRFQQFTDECAKKTDTGCVQFVTRGAGTVYSLPKYAEYGTQSVFNIALIEKRDDIMSGVYPIRSGELQSYLPEYIHYCSGDMYQFAKWDASKYLVHLIGLRPNHPKFKNKLDVIMDFFQKYPQYEETRHD